MKKFSPILLIAGVLVLAIGGGALLYRMQGETGPAPKPGTTVNRPIPLGAQPEHIRGRSDAPILVEEFGDFECPVCGQFYKVLKQVESEYGSQVKVVFREYPIQQIHPHALEGAHAAEAAGIQGKFWEMHDLLYENQETWAKETNPIQTFDTYASSLGLDVTKFNNDMNGNVVSSRIMEDDKRRSARGVTGTPTIFIDDQLQSNRSIDGLRNAINQALKEKGL
ncbi:MAG TPA: thioredoxin domain-containing protein [Blastocatellia bacterium]|nr:thioredoxin domain-containing protein [Blastocatellia bacterium]